MALAAATFFSTDTASVPPNVPIPLNSGSRIEGLGLYLLNATDVRIDNPGVYLVSYYFQGDPVDGIETLSCCLRVNGNTVPGSIVQSVTSPEANIVEPSVSNTCLLPIEAPGALLQLFNTSGTAISHLRWVAGFCGASLTLFRIR